MKISDSESLTDIPEMPLGDHLSELRIRIIYSLLALLVTFVFALFWGWEIISFVSSPLIAVLSYHDQPTVFLVTGISTAFTTYIKVAFIAAAFFASPIVFYHLWSFIASGLMPVEKRAAVIFSFFSAVLFVLGGLFFIFVVAPVTINFFLTFNSGFKIDSSIHPWFQEIIAVSDISSDQQLSNNTGHTAMQSGEFTIETRCTINEYISFIINLSLAFGLSFQMPLAVYTAGRLNIITLDKLCAFRKYMILVIVCVSAIVTPPDVISQLALSLPVYILYELGIFILKRSKAGKGA